MYTTFIHHFIRLLCKNTTKKQKKHRIFNVFPHLSSNIIILVFFATKMDIFDASTVNHHLADAIFHPECIRAPPQASKMTNIYISPRFPTFHTSLSTLSRHFFMDENDAM